VSDPHDSAQGELHTVQNQQFSICEKAFLLPAKLMVASGVLQLRSIILIPPKESSHAFTSVACGTGPAGACDRL